MTRTAFAHDAVVVLDAGGDIAAPGAAVTLALCGGWDHPPPCPLAPHHTAARPDGDMVRVRILFAAHPADEQRVRSLIGEALATGGLTGPDGQRTIWTLQSEAASPIGPDDQFPWAEY